jgi:Flp pilus assembly pilin Flp
MSQEKKAYGTVVSRRGQTMTEYVMILTMVAAICVALFENGGNIVTALISHVDPLL